MMETFSSARKKKENVRCQKVSHALWHLVRVTAFTLLLQLCCWLYIQL